ncbi:Sister chromatid cohesion protein DCC1 [Eumeta japonica]|uniref:Sister chromatid cohesion protein DCC1 n=1 Tax=Eumeta variegata TaxID=151549 RepID=A0A4C1WU61_EUMVA|nr:Sister chromatid cohesion protein DCC1 [Eumeta japonica]
MQLDDNLLKELESGKELIFKGDPDENVVLCTEDKTYDVKEAETSNSLLLAPELLFADATGIASTNGTDSLNNSDSFDKSNNSLNRSTDSDDAARPPRRIEFKNVVNTFFTYYELKPCKPRLSKLRKLLDSTKYRGPEQEYLIEKTELYDYDRLLDAVQASRREIDEELIKIQAIELDGFYRLLEFDYEFRVLSYMLDLIEENSWPLNRISKEITMDSLKDLTPNAILEAAFNFYTVPSIVEDGIQYYQYKEDKVCRFLARVLLKSAGRFNLAEFLQAWSDSVPEGMVTNETQLRGIALMDKSSTPQVIWGFLESDLPEDINERFGILFRSKDKWTVDEISPYVDVHSSESQSWVSMDKKPLAPVVGDMFQVFYNGKGASCVWCA